jgi:hypothetical protein
MLEIVVLDFHDGDFALTAHSRLIAHTLVLSHRWTA